MVGSSLGSPSGVSGTSMLPSSAPVKNERPTIWEGSSAVTRTVREPNGSLSVTRGVFFSVSMHPSSTVVVVAARRCHLAQRIV